MATRQLLLLTVLGPLLIGLSIIAFRALPLPATWQPWRDTLTGLLAVALLAAYLVVVVGVAWYMAVGGPNRQMVGIGARLGLTPQRSAGLEQRIGGVWRGRRATVLFHAGGFTHHVIQVKLVADSTALV